MNQATLVRQYLNEGILVAPGAYDALSAKVFEKAGFKAVMLGGFSLSASLLGQPDVGLLTLPEVVTQARNVARALTVPLLVDGEDGYGGVVNVQRTVREMEDAGVAGIFIEDQEHPVKCGAISQYKRVLPAEEMVVKLSAALDARRNPDFIIGARTDSDIIGMEEQIRRCNLYAETGADLVMPLGVTRDDFRQFVSGIKCPLWTNLAPHLDVSLADLEEMGYRGIVIFPVEALFVAMKAVQDLAAELMEKGTTKATLSKVAAPGYGQFFKFMDLRKITGYEEALRARAVPVAQGV